jgi:GNAT superfamily N-acetyltransferase
MGISSSKQPRDHQEDHPEGPVFTLRKHRPDEKPLRIMLRSYKTKKQKDLAIDFLDDIPKMKCHRLTSVLDYELYKNVNRYRNRTDRELILATDVHGPNSIAGFMFLKHRKKIMYIHLLEACYEKRGIGSILLKYCIDKAKASGTKYIELVSLKSPATLRFYESKGFVRGPVGAPSRIKPTNWEMVNYSSSNNDEKKEKLPKLHLVL